LRRPAAGQQKVVGPQDRQQVDIVAIGIGEEMDNLAPVGDNLQRLAAKIIKRQMWNAVTGNCLAIADLNKIRVH
jgi:hypothetical protein